MQKNSSLHLLIVRARLEIKLGTKCSQFEMFMKFTITGFVFVALLSLD